MLLLFWHQIWMLAGFLYIFRYIFFFFWYLNFTPENENDFILDKDVSVSNLRDEKMLGIISQWKTVLDWLLGSPG